MCKKQKAFWREFAFDPDAFSVLKLRDYAKNYVQIVYAHVSAHWETTKW